jgi:hypothetical protein
MSLHVLARLHYQCISNMSWGRALLPWGARWSGAKQLMARWGLLGMKQKPSIVGTSLCCNFQHHCDVFFWWTIVQTQCAQHIDGANHVTPLPKFFSPFSRTVVQIQCHDDDSWKHSHFKITLKRLRRQGRRGFLLDSH